MGDVGITNGDTGFLMGYLGSTLVPLEIDIKRSLKLIQVCADNGLRSRSPISHTGRAC